MVVCRFYMQGGCKFGQNCRFEHPNQSNQQQGVLRPSSFSNSGEFPGVSSRLQSRLGPQNQGRSIFNPQRGAQNQQTQGPSQGNSVNEVFTTISQEMNIWQQSKMWPFSCFGYAKSIACLPGLEDLSTEEVRLKAYEANNTGTVASYQQWIKGLINEYTKIRQQLENPDVALRSKLTVFIEDSMKNVSSDGSSQMVKTSGTFSGASPLNSGQSTFGGSAFGTSAVSAFGAQPQPPNTATSIFGAQTQPLNSGSSVFGGQAQPSTGASVFGGQPQQPKPGSSVFGGQPQQANSGSSIFGGQPQQPNSGSSIFGGQAQQPNPGSSVFGTPAQAQNKGASLFGSSATSVFGSQTPQATTGVVFGGQAQPQNSATSVISSSNTGSVFSATQPNSATSVFGGQQPQTQQLSNSGQSSLTGLLQQGQAPSQGTSLFGATPAPATSQSAFTAISSSQSATTSAFGSVPQQTQQTSVLGGATQPAFGATPQLTSTVTTTNSTGTTMATGLFGKPASTASQTGSSISSFSFAASSQTPGGTAPNPGQSQPVGLFGKPAQASVFGGSAFGGSSAAPDVNKDWYTPLDVLTEQEKEQFMAETFTAGKIPIRPPPIELC